MSFWNANLTFLGSRAEPWSRALAAALAEAGPAPDLGLRSRSGSVLPGIVVDGRPRSLISSFDARREAERWAEGGGTVVMISSEIDEVLGMSDRIMVMRGGKSAGIYSREETNAQSLVHLST